MTPTDDLLLERITGEFHEMPGLRLTVRQASRFWQIDHSVCEDVLRQLVQSDVLYRTMDGYYIGRSHTRPSRQAAQPRS